jgi:hypothetical protein
MSHQLGRVAIDNRSARAEVPGHRCPNVPGQCAGESVPAKYLLSVVRFLDANSGRTGVTQISRRINKTLQNRSRFIG